MPGVVYIVVIMDTRRDFLKKAALLSGGTGLLGVLPTSVQRALAIDPAPGSSFMDAEHIVLLMQENRSFDHCFGTLKGVRGFNDPRAIKLPDDNLVWLQSDSKGRTYAPFRLDLKDSKVTWMSSLPHSWENQVDARNDGDYDRWLDVKRSGNKEYADLPLTMGYFTREDIPFYYSLADAFTVCDQNFCSSLTGTTPNRLYFWSGTIREQQNTDAAPNVRNEEVDYPVPASWTTFPERLEDNGISWKVYQNELSVGVGFNGEEDQWLANFTDNPLEFFSQYRPQFLETHYNHLKKSIAQLSLAIKEEKNTVIQEEKKALLARLEEEAEKWSPEKYAALSQREKNLHEKAFTTNKNDPDYHQLTSLQYDDDGKERTVKVPKGDVLHQFREDVKNKQLPAVSWLVAPENFSDHPGAPWYGAWYVSEVLDILTQDPEVWKKTIFVLAYDENDGDFDHVPPFVPPYGEGKGLVSEGIDTSVEYVTMEQEMRKKGMKKEHARESPIGLGYRVPLIIASPWSRGGYVCSEVFDHTSVLQFLEHFLSNKTGKKIEESNISQWRRTVCGDLTSVFRPYNGEKLEIPTPVERDTFIETIHKAQFREVPSGFKQLTPDEVRAINKNPFDAPYMAKQEEGIRPACALPYELYVDGGISRSGSFEITLAAGTEVAGKKSAGAPFHIYEKKYGKRAYTVAAGDSLTDKWLMSEQAHVPYDFKVYGPNGFFREFHGFPDGPLLDIKCRYERRGKQFTGNVELLLVNNGKRSYAVQVRDNAYNADIKPTVLASGQKAAVVLELKRSYGWYDFTVFADGGIQHELAYTYAGHVETGNSSFSDPFMGRVKL